MASLQKIQETMVALWGSRDEYDNFAKQGQLPGLSPQLASVIDRSQVKQYVDDIAKRRFTVTRNCYPLTVKLLGKNSRSIVEKYWMQNRSTNFNPLDDLHNLPAFLRTQQDCKSFPYIADLAEYEWTRYQVKTDPAPIHSSGGVNWTSQSQMRMQSPVLNPTIKLKQFQYPVHKFAKRVASGRWKNHNYSQSSFYFVLFQKPEARLEIVVVELDEPTFRVIEYAQKEDSSYTKLIKFVRDASEFDRESAIGLLQQFESAGIIVGSKALLELDR